MILMGHKVLDQIINTEFTDEELYEIEISKEATGLNWHDFILDVARLYNR